MEQVLRDGEVHTLWNLCSLTYSILVKRDKKQYYSRCTSIHLRLITMQSTSFWARQRLSSWSLACVVSKVIYDAVSNIVTVQSRYMAKKIYNRQVSSRFVSANHMISTDKRRGEQTFWIRLPSTLHRYRADPSSGFVELLHNRFTLTRVDSCMRTSAVSSSVTSPSASTSPSVWVPNLPCVGPVSLSTTMQRKMANNLSRGKLPGPFNCCSCASASFLSIADEEFLFIITETSDTICRTVRASSHIILKSASTGLNTVGPPWEIWQMLLANTFTES